MVTSTDVEIPMGVALHLGDLESSVLVPASLKASSKVAASRSVLAAPYLPLLALRANLHVDVVEFGFLYIISDGYSTD